MSFPTDHSQQLWLIRHGETAWSKTGQHTGRQDLPLTTTGEEQARQVGRFLAGRPFSLVLVSPLQRARQTCRIAGYDAVAHVDDRMQEWDYGLFGGKTSAEIREEIAGWDIWKDGVRGGETVEQVAERARAVLDRCQTAEGDVILFAHGHFLRILAATWMGLAPRDAAHLAFTTGCLGILGYERENPVILTWNRPVVD